MPPLATPCPFRTYEHPLASKNDSGPFPFNHGIVLLTSLHAARLRYIRSRIDSQNPEPEATFPASRFSALKGSVVPWSNYHTVDKCAKLYYPGRTRKKLVCRKTYYYEKSCTCIPKIHRHTSEATHWLHVLKPCTNGERTWTCKLGN